MKKSDLIKALFDGYAKHDRSTVERVLADSFRFTSPYDDAIDRATYFERCWPNHTKQHAIEIERIFDHGDGAFVTYNFLKDTEEQVRNTEYFTFTASDEQIATVDVYFGAVRKDGKLVKS